MSLLATLLATFCLCGGGGGATATGKAVRLNPPPPTTTVAPVPVLFTSDSANGRCVGAEFLLGYYSPGWDVARMSRYAYRESRCDPTVFNADGTQGLLQITRINYAYLRAHGLPATDLWLRDPVNNIQAAAVMWQYNRYTPWDCCVS